MSHAASISFWTLLVTAVLAGVARADEPITTPSEPAAETEDTTSARQAPDPTDRHRWHMPHRGAHQVSPNAAGPVHAEWNYIGHLTNAGKEKLQDWGIEFDADLVFFDQYASRVISGRHNFATYSWRIMGNWNLFDLGDSKRFSGLGRGYVSWNTFGTAGLDYDPGAETLTGNVGAVNTLNATVFDEGAVVDELYWKQVALEGKLLVLGGKIDMVYHFDTNRIANDAYSQFFSYSLQNNPSIPGPLYGGFGGIVRGNLSKDAYVMFGVGDSSMSSAELPWETLSNDSWYQLLELGMTPAIPKLGKGTYRLTPWHNHLFGADGFGIALNIDQELGWKELVAFLRFGWGDDDVTPVKTFVSGGLGLEAPFGRKRDLAAIGLAWADPSSGAGSREETLVELLYRFEIAHAISITPDLQLVFNPADNLEDDFVVVPGIRLGLVF